MVDATIVIPTYRHPAFLPFAVRTALAQEHENLEVFVIGDGVEDDTRAALEEFKDSIRFFDFPKGERHGERHRHVALQEARGDIVCYLGDDDLLLPNHVSEMLCILKDADFTHSVPVFLKPDRTFIPGWMDLSREEFRDHLIRGDWNQISLTGAAHTMDAYRRLPFGWRPAPEGKWTDLHMWQQFLATPGMRMVSGALCTHLKFTEEWRAEMSVEERVAELVYWMKKMHATNMKTEFIHLAESSRKQSQDYRVGSYTCLGPPPRKP